MSKLVSQIAKRTGESLRTVKNRGFQILAIEGSDDDESNDGLLLVDCPCCGKAIFLAEDADELPELADCDHCDTLFEYGDDEVYPLDGATARHDDSVRLPYGLT